MTFLPGRISCPQALRGPVTDDSGSTPIIVALGDDQESELGLPRIHGQDGEIINDELAGA